MQKNDKMLCRILNYIPHERTFEVEELVSKTRGFVIFVNNYQNIPILKEAYKKGKNIGAPDKPCGVGRADANPKLLLNDT